MILFKKLSCRAVLGRLLRQIFFICFLQDLNTSLEVFLIFSNQLILLSDRQLQVLLFYSHVLHLHLKLY